ncbi:hypothetical protein CDL15_Pgr023480 [Punica granatum]|uniref:Uncharacterized protein n=1 Tax=Punica granatum TaxID=22663 RepID=A0A218W6X3_PUNGR|nr:hypothetical protein CDL15_Pgr023480 [Punica granatum]PKI59593.1 hypothetical protein CRG98_020002 [Punica granatum]
MPLLGRVWTVFELDVTTDSPDGILRQDQWLPTPKRLLEVAVVVIWFQTYRVDPYNPAKITENRVRLENKPRLGSFRVGRHHGVSRWNFEVRPVAPDF